jgi:hypothetical protein
MSGLLLLLSVPAGGWLILTLKFYGRGREKASMVQHLDKYFQVRLWLCLLCAVLPAMLLRSRGPASMVQHLDTYFFSFQVRR